jgi:hypothetical protein
LRYSISAQVHHPVLIDRKGIDRIVAAMAEADSTLKILVGDGYRTQVPNIDAVLDGAPAVDELSEYLVGHAQTQLKEAKAKSVSVHFNDDTYVNFDDTDKIEEVCDKHPYPIRIMSIEKGYYSLRMRVSMGNSITYSMSGDPRYTEYLMERIKRAFKLSEPDYPFIYSPIFTVAFFVFISVLVLLSFGLIVDSLKPFVEGYAKLLALIPIIGGICIAVISSSLTVAFRNAFPRITINFGLNARRGGAKRRLLIGIGGMFLLPIISNVVSARFTPNAPTVAKP